MTTKRILTLAAVGTLAAVSTVAISLTSWLGASAADAGTVRLHLGADAQRFTLGTTVQNITVGKNTCAINAPAAQQLINLTSVPTGSANKASAPGLANYGLGVKESPSSGNGNPCAQITSPEALTFKPGSLLNGRAFKEVTLDLEMTGDALVTASLARGNGAPAVYTLQTGHSITNDQTIEPGYDKDAPYEVSSNANDVVDACAAPNSSGPNSGGNDNCRWTITPGFDFDTLTISSTLGTVTVEGGGDFGTGTERDTLFVLGGTPPVANDDSAQVLDGQTSVQIDVLDNDTDADGDALSIAGIVQPSHGTAVVDSGQIRYTPTPGYVGVDSFQYTATDGIYVSNAATVSLRACSPAEQTITDGLEILATFTRLTDVEVCKLNTVDVSTSESSVLFQPQGDPDEPADYRGVITFGPKTPSFNGAGAIQLLLKYDVTGTGNNYSPVPWCISPHFDGAGLVDGATMPNAIDTWCIATETTTGVGDDPLDPQLVKTTWQVFGIDDPKFQ